MTTQRITAWDDAFGIRLPQSIMQQIGLSEGALVSLSVEGNKVVLSLEKSTEKPKYEIEALLAHMTPEMQHDEIEWGAAAGEEIW